MEIKSMISQPNMTEIEILKRICKNLPIIDDESFAMNTNKETANQKLAGMLNED